MSVSHAGIFKLQVSDSGILLGAENVEVNKKFYNVRFDDGTCEALFNGCDEVSDFVFNTSAVATAASFALLEQVFKDVNLTNLFGSRPDLTFGCSHINYCLKSTLYVVNGRGQFKSVAAENWVGTAGGVVYGHRLMVRSQDTSQETNVTFAVWSVAEVPAPSTVILTLMSIGGLLVLRRRKQY